MALTRPVRGDPVTVEEFGQPVYDKLIFGEGYAGGTLTSGALTTGTPIPISNRVTGDATAWDITQGDGSLVCKRAGVYFCMATIIISGLGGAATGTYLGCGVSVNGTVRINMVGGVGKFWDTVCNSGFLTLVANDKIKMDGGSDIPNIVVDNRSWISLVPLKG